MKQILQTKHIYYQSVKDKLMLSVGNCIFTIYSFGFYCNENKELVGLQGY